MSSVNVLFYSNKCDASQYLIALLKSENLLRFFHQICTDNNPKVPLQIKYTPTIIIRNNPTPYVAGDAFIWVSKIKQWKVNIMMQKMTSAQQQYMQAINNNLKTNDSNILGFSEAEMSGMSDIFAFFSKDMTKECQDPFPQSFFTCNNLGNENIFTPPKEEDKFKINDKKHKELYNNLEKERKIQDELFKKNIENFQNEYSK